MKTTCIIFDLDGTLMDTSKGILNGIDFIIDQFHLTPMDDLKKQTFIGPPIQDSFQSHYCCSTEESWELATAWREVYKDRFLLEAVPYNDIYDLLQRLKQKNVKMCVATNKREDYTMKLLEYYGFIPLFDFIAGSDLEGKRSKADMIKMCMEWFGEKDPGRYLMIGDTEKDLEAAQEVGVNFLGVTYGFGFTNDQNDLGFPLVGNVNELLTVLEHLI